MGKYIFVAILILLISCTKEKTQTLNYAKKFNFEVTDTIRFPVEGREIRVVDMNKSTGNLLLASVFDPIQVIQTDSNFKIINRFLIGNSKTVPFNISYLNDTCILVNHNKGFTFYDLRGKICKRIDDPTELKTLGTDVFKPRSIQIDTNTIALHLKNSLNSKDLEAVFTLESYAKYKPITIYNLSSKVYTQIGGYEKESMFYQKTGIFKNLHHYGDPTNLFDYNSQSQTFYSLNDPDTVLYSYNKNNNIIKKIGLMPEHIQLPIDFSFPGKNDFGNNKYMSVNSSFIDLNSSNNDIIVTYRTGIPEKEFDALEMEYDRPKLWVKFMKYYSIILTNERKISNDIILPYGAAGITCFKSRNYIIMPTNSYIVGKKGYTTFYKAKLTEIKK